MYKLTETIAPKGYILSKETIEFKLDENGVIYKKIQMENLLKLM